MTAPVEDAPRLLLGVVADDLTGGSELASVLASRGVPTGFTTSIDQAIDPTHRAHVLAMKTRVIPAEDAVSLVLAGARKFLDIGCRQIFFKFCATFDSTPAGNIGPCAAALADLVDARLTPFCSAYCEIGRTVFQGHIFGGAQLLAESPKRLDPLTPMTDSNAVRILAGQTDRKVGLVPHPVVDRGADAIAQRCRQLTEEGVDFAILDALYERDLAAIGEAIADMPLVAGNSSIGAHLPPVWLRRKLISGTAAVRLPGVDGPAAVLVGSVAPLTLEQAARFGQSHPLIVLDMHRAFAGADLVEEAFLSARPHLDAGRPVAISTAAPQETVEQLQARHGRHTVAARAEAILSALAGRLIGEGGVRRLIVAGGETAGAIVPSLPVDRIAIGPYEGPGISRLVVDMPFPVAMMLKSGKLGEPDIFERVLEAMRHPVDSPPFLTQWPPSEAKR